MVLLMLFAADSRADIYKWEDGSGAIHFTDDLSNVPAGFRSKATMVIREAPRAAEPAPSSPRDQDAGQPRSAPGEVPSREDQAAVAARERESLTSEVKQLKAKIAAKEKLIRFVDDRQNLALNPYRSRVVDPGDLELYRKYQAELPEDRRKLQDLESRLELLK
jgi:hypothetical protein